MPAANLLLLLLLREASEAFSLCGSVYTDKGRLDTGEGSEVILIWLNWKLMVLVYVCGCVYLGMSKREEGYGLQR